MLDDDDRVECFAWSYGRCRATIKTPSKETCGKCRFRKKEAEVTNGRRYPPANTGGYISKKAGMKDLLD